jgi:hypothetical protein
MALITATAAVAAAHGTHPARLAGRRSSLAVVMAVIEYRRAPPL